MRHAVTLALRLIIAVLALAPLATADVPQMINYQGYLTDSTGALLDTTVSMEFAIYDDSTGGVLKWAETRPSVTVEGGTFSIILGTMVPIDDSVFNQSDRWLGITIGANPELTPRTRLVSVGYSHRVSTVDGSTGGIISGDVSIQSDFVVSGKATIGPGHTNTGPYAFVAGENNVVSGEKSTVGGGYENSASAPYTTVGGGVYNTANTDWATVGGGYANTAGWLAASVGGGDSNTASGETSTIGGGESNEASGLNSTISGGGGNIAAAEGVAIGGGIANTGGDTCAAIGGGRFNVANGSHSTVAGGRSNYAVGLYASVGGGINNHANEYRATVAGGYYNTADSTGATVGGGSNNEANSRHCTVAGGSSNIASGQYATIGGGNQCIASGHRSVVSGGMQDTASGAGATVAGGEENVAEGNYSFAAGYRAKARGDGSFAWADHSPYDFESSTSKEFAVRCTGGARFVTGIDGSGNPNAGVQVAAGGGSWSSISDKNLKENFVQVDRFEVLEKVASLPISTWNYKAQDESIRHIGPMAQDFHAAFGVGEDDRHITTIDANGVALAAIQQLHRTQQELKERVQRIEQLEIKVAQLEALVETILAKQDGSNEPKAEFGINK